MAWNLMIAAVEELRRREEEARARLFQNQQRVGLSYQLPSPYGPGEEETTRSPLEQMRAGRGRAEPPIASVDELQTLQKVQTRSKPNQMPFPYGSIDEYLSAIKEQARQALLDAPREPSRQARPEPYRFQTIEGVREGTEPYRPNEPFAGGPGLEAYRPGLGSEHERRMAIEGAHLEAARRGLPRPPLEDLDTPLERATQYVGKLDPASRASAYEDDPLAKHAMIMSMRERAAEEEERQRQAMLAADRQRYARADELLGAYGLGGREQTEPSRERLAGIASGIASAGAVTPDFMGSETQLSLSALQNNEKFQAAQSARRERLDKAREMIRERHQREAMTPQERFMEAANSMMGGTGGPNLAGLAMLGFPDSLLTTLGRLEEQQREIAANEVTNRAAIQAARDTGEAETRLAVTAESETPLQALQRLNQLGLEEDFSRLGPTGEAVFSAIADAGKRTELYEAIASGDLAAAGHVIVAGASPAVHLGVLTKNQYRQFLQKYFPGQEAAVEDEVNRVYPQERYEAQEERRKARETRRAAAFPGPTGVFPIGF